jgi:hypothetical protein
MREQMRGDVPVRALPQPPELPSIATPAEEIGLDPGLPVPMLAGDDLSRIQGAQDFFPSIDMPFDEDRAAREMGATNNRQRLDSALRGRLLTDADTADAAGQPDVAEELRAAAGRLPSEELLSGERMSLADEMTSGEPLAPDNIEDILPPLREGETPTPSAEEQPTSPPAEDPLQELGTQLDRDLRTFFGIEQPSRAPGSRRERVEQELELIREVFGDRTRDKARDRAMNLAMIGLAIAAGQSPNMLTNIAQGALAGTQAMSRAQASAQEREDEQRMLAYRNVLEEEQETRRLGQAMGLERFRASLRGGEGSRFGTVTHPVNQWFTARNQLDQQARDTSSDLWSQLQEMPEEQRGAYLDRLAFSRVESGFGADTPEVQEIRQALQSGALSAAFSASGTPPAGAAALPVVTSRAEYDSLPSGAEFIQNGQRRRKP